MWGVLLCRSLGGWLAVCGSHASTAPEVITLNRLWCLLNSSGPTKRAGPRTE